MTGADLNHWLDQATQGVPQHRAASIRAELTAHFEDTAAELRQQGAPEDTVRQRALAALGNPRAVANGFNDVHRGRRHYLLAALACVLLLVENFDLPQRFLMPDWAAGSAQSRIFYAIDHGLTILLGAYVVFVMGRLLVWRFNQEVVRAPVNIALGGLIAHLIGSVILDLGAGVGGDVPTLLNASNFAEGIGSLLQGSGILLTGTGMIALGVSVLPTLNRPGKGIALSATVEGMTVLLYVILLYTDSAFLYAYLLLALNSVILLLAIMLVFMHAWISYRRLPAQTA